MPVKLSDDMSAERVDFKDWMTPQGRHALRLWQDTGLCAPTMIAPGYLTNLERADTKILTLKAQLAAAEKRASEAANERDSLYQGIHFLVNAHACYTGDCPHTNANLCTFAIRAYLLELFNDNPARAQAVAEVLAKLDDVILQAPSQKALLRGVQTTWAAYKAKLDAAGKGE